MDRESYSKMEKYEDSHWWFKARRKIIGKFLSSHLKSDNPISILEIGCGSGGNLRLLSSFGKLHAMELDGDALEAAKSRKICEVRKGSLPADVPFTEKFDLICLFDVLEHIDDEHAALCRIQGMLTPNGRLLLTVPAFMSLWSAHDRALNHKRRYRRDQVTGIVRKAAFGISYSTYFNTILFPCIALARFFNNLFVEKQEDDLEMPSDTVNSLLCRILSSETIFIPGLSLPFGVSILVLAEKSEK